MVKDLKYPVNTPPPYSCTDARIFRLLSQTEEVLNSRARFELECAALFAPFAAHPSYEACPHPSRMDSNYSISSRDTPAHRLFSEQDFLPGIFGASLAPTMALYLQKAEPSLRWGRAATGALRRR
jgi:hypothetical protein